MGMGMPFLEYFGDRGLLARGASVFDVGTQNLYGAAPDAIRRFVERFGCIAGEEAFRREAERISYYSRPRPGERTAYVSELFDLVDITYESIDICPALKSDILDLNIERLPFHQRGQFDLVLNFGTTEHVFNQLNAFEVMHDAAKVGGVVYHLVPSIGYVDHGYFNYNALLLDELAQANRYEIVDKFFTPSGQSEFGQVVKDVRDPERPGIRNGGRAGMALSIPNFNLAYAVRKTVDAPFYVGLELATTHAPLSDRVTRIYGPDRRLPVADRLRTMWSYGSDEASKTRDLPNHDLAAQVQRRFDELSLQVHNTTQALSRQIYESEVRVSSVNGKTWFRPLRRLLRRG